ncbi:unnamed protein product [Paramecium sonneborni]|uniref:NAD(P)H-hydrate epimerase n=1 Tax=Paramecium sonneborni TaxID=65129 RepID=A0A8S1Q232_9CILI|nr:unnamed protein product [Paramecium sonneborni]
MQQINKVSYLNQVQSQQFDVELMSDEVGFTLDQLMELAGQSVANTVVQLNKQGNSYNKILVLCGPGNNGGDGIVSARHLKQFGLQPEIVLFKEVKNPYFNRLLNQCKYNLVPIHYQIQDFEKYDLLIDAILGFSFKPPLREPFDKPIYQFKTTKTPILSVDIPSGWDVEKGNTQDLFNPQYLISLTLPKLGVKSFKGRHFIGGRFIPLKLQEKYNFIVPQYQGSDTILELSNL